MILTSSFKSICCLFSSVRTHGDNKVKYTVGLRIDQCEADALPINYRTNRKQYKYKIITVIKKFNRRILKANLS